MITVIHKECGGPAVESDVLHGHENLKRANELSFTCLTCLEEITAPDELIFGEDMVK